MTNLFSDFEVTAVLNEGTYVQFQKFWLLQCQKFRRLVADPHLNYRGISVCYQPISLPSLPFCPLHSIVHGMLLTFFLSLMIRCAWPDPLQGNCWLHFFPTSGFEISL